MPASLPPWLEINPTQNFLSAASLGADIGAKQRAQGFDEYKVNRSFADEEATTAQDMAMKKASLAASLQQTQQENQMRMAQLSQQAKQAEQQHAESTAQLQIEAQKAEVSNQTAKMQANLEWSQAAQKYQAQQQYQQVYQQLVDGGADPSEAAMQATMRVGPSQLGDTGSGSAALWKQAGMLAKVPTAVDLGDGTKGVTYNGQLHLITKSDVSDDTSAQDAKDQQASVSNARDVIKDYYSLTSKGMKPDAQLTKLYNKAVKLMESVGLSVDGEGDYSETGGGAVSQPSNNDPLGIR